MGRDQLSQVLRTGVVPSVFTRRSRFLEGYCLLSNKVEYTAPLHEGQDLIPHPPVDSRGVSCNPVPEHEALLDNPASAVISHLTPGSINGPMQELHCYQHHPLDDLAPSRKSYLIPIKKLWTIPKQPCYRAGGLALCDAKIDSGIQNFGLPVPSDKFKIAEYFTSRVNPGCDAYPVK